MNRIFSISNRSRSNNAARTVFDAGANELRILFSGEGAAPSCELATAWFLPQRGDLSSSAHPVSRDRQS